MKKQVINTSDEAARLASVRVRVYNDPFGPAPWDDDRSAPLVYWSPDYQHDRNAQNSPTVENDDGSTTTAPGVLRAIVYAYEHGGITVSTRPQVCGGVPCGCVWCWADKFREAFGDGVTFEAAAAAFVEEIDAYYNGRIYGVAVEEWSEARRDWEQCDGCGGFYPCGDNAETLAEIIAPGLQPGRVVCSDCVEFVGLEYDDGEKATAAV